jgi:hypothetical protein
MKAAAMIEKRILMLVLSLVVVVEVLRITLIVSAEER